MRAWASTLFAYIMALLIPVSAQACDVSGWLALRSNPAHPIQAEISLSHRPIRVGDPFAIDLAVCGAGDAEVDRITINAIMPVHRHGMNYKPVIAKLGKGRYRAQSFVFHMPGLWQIIVTLYHNGQPIRLMRDFQVK